MRYVIRLERFTAGDFPMVCVHSGRPASQLVPVQARRSTTWPWFFLPISVFAFLLTKLVSELNHPWGRLPATEGQALGIEAVHDRSIGVILDGVHPDFVAAVRESQGKSA